MHNDVGLCGLGERSLSTGDPQMGIAERFAQIGHHIYGYTQAYTQSPSTTGENLGIVVASGPGETCVDCVNTQTRCSLRRPGLGLDAAGEVGHLVEQGAPLSHQLSNFPVGVHDRGVVATTEGLADLRQGKVGQLPA